MKTTHKYRRLAFLLALPLLVLVADAADAHSPKRRPAPPVEVPAAAQVAPSDPLPAWSIPPRGLHPCGSRTKATPSIEVQRATYSAAAEFGISAPLMFAIFRGESEYNPNAANPSSSARGLGQHLGRYWPDRVRAFNRANPGATLASTSIFSISAQTRVTAFMLSGGMGRNGRRAWAC